MNLEDSSMTLLRGHFAMTLICSGSADLARGRGGDQLRWPAMRCRSSVREVVGRARPGARGGETYLVTVHGADRLGIVARLATVIADGGGNITDLTTRLSGDLYVLLAEVDLPAGDRPRPRSRPMLGSRKPRPRASMPQLRPLERDEL